LLQSNSEEIKRISFVQHSSEALLFELVAVLLDEEEEKVVVEEESSFATTEITLPAPWAVDTTQSLVFSTI
jgi:hypothetical protein